MNYRRITERIADSCTLSEIYTHYVLAFKSDYETMISNVKQETLAEIRGVDLTTIQRHLYKMQKLDLIEIETKVVNNDGNLIRRNSYRLSDDNYKYITDKLLTEDISDELKGFLILLKCRCYNCQNNLLYSVRGLAETVKISKSTIDRYLKEAEAKGYIKRDKKRGITLLRSDIFIEAKESLYYAVSKTYPSYLTDEDINEHLIHNH